jgi:hypothetical protein
VQSDAAVISRSLVTIQGTQALILQEAAQLNTTVANAAVLVGEATAAVATLEASLATAAASAAAAAASDADAAAQAATAAADATAAAGSSLNAAASANAAAASAASIAGGPVASVAGFTGIVTASEIFTSPALLGAPTTPTASPGDNSSTIANTAFVTASFAPLQSPAFIGSPSVPTPSVNDDSTRAASTAYVIGQASSSNPVMNGSAAPGSSLSWSRADHVHPSDTSRLSTMGGALSGSIGFAPIVTVASASTVNLGALSSNVALITGTVTITSFGSTALSGYMYFLSFASALTLTNSASLVLPGAANITTAAGDTCFVICSGSGNWTVSSYQRASGIVIVPQTMAVMPTDAITGSIEFVMSGSGIAIPTGLQGWLQVPFPGTIQSVTLLADQTGSITVDIWKCSFSQYAPGTHPVVADSICAGDVPAISSASKSTDASLVGWTTTINSGDILAFNVKVAAVNITQCLVSLKILKT